MPKDARIDQFLECFKQARQIVEDYRDQAPKGFDPQATGIAIAIGAAAVVAAGATAYSASSAADSANQANQTNAQIASSNRALQYQQFLESRGAKGSAILPAYPSFTSANVEQNLGNQAYATYLAEQQALGTPEQQIQSYQQIVNGLEPSMAAGDQLVNDLFSGSLEKQQESNIAPVLAARGAVAGAQKQGVLEGLIERLNAIDAQRARAGYEGGGSALEKNVLTAATIPALQAAGTVGAQADLANASDVAALKQADINTRLTNLSLPLTQAGNRLQLKTLPATAAGTTYNNSLAPFQFFKLNPGAPQFVPSPYVQPVPGVGAIVGGAVGSGASSLGNYFATQSLLKQYQNGQANPYSTGYSTNFGNGAAVTNLGSPPAAYDPSLVMT